VKSPIDWWQRAKTLIELIHTPSQRTPDVVTHLKFFKMPKPIKITGRTSGA